MVRVRARAGVGKGFWVGGGKRVPTFSFSVFLPLMTGTASSSSYTAA